MTSERTDASQGAASYFARGTLRSGRPLIIRAYAPSDQAALVAAVARTSAQSLYRRFFTAKHSFNEREKAFFFNVDFVSHVALMALVEEDAGPAIIGGGRYVVVETGKAELAFVVIDPYQGQGVGTALFQHLVTIARSAGLTSLVAEVLAENAPMLRVFRTSGLPMSTTCKSGVVEINLQLSR